MLKVLNKQNLSEVWRFLISSIGQNWSLRNGYFFFLKPHHKVKFFSCRSFFQFLDFHFYILPKIELKSKFPRFQSFQFWVYGKIKNLENSNFWFQGDYPVMRVYISKGEVSSASVHVPILKWRISKIQKFLPVVPSFSVFSFPNLM